jgi:hypothetical protein
MTDPLDDRPLDDRPIEGLDTLAVPDPGPTFWNDLHEHLVAADPHVGAATTVVVLPTERDRSPFAHRRLLAVAAVLVVVVAGLAAFRLVRRDDPRPANRVDVVIDDPHAIDLDDLRRDDRGYEPDPSGPYLVYAFPEVEAAGGEVVGSGYDIRDTNGTWDWRWFGAITLEQDPLRAWQLFIGSPETGTAQLPSGDPLTVRGRPGVQSGDDSNPSVTWIEDGQRVQLHWMSDEPFDLDETLSLAASFERVEIDGPLELPVIDSGGGPFVRDESSPMGGTIDGHEWWIDTSPQDDEAVDSTTIVVDGSLASSMGGPEGGAMRMTTTLVWGRGRFYAGVVDGDLASVGVVLSDGNVVTLPAVDQGDTTLWVVPIPVGLDVTAIELRHADGSEPKVIRVPIYLDQAGTSVGPA